MNKINFGFLFTLGFCVIITGCATNDIVIYGADKTDNHQKQLKSWLVASCDKPEDCQRLTDPLANCRVSGNEIECANKHTYYCDPNSSWHIIDHDYHKAYFCTNQKPVEPTTAVPDANF